MPPPARRVKVAVRDPLTGDMLISPTIFESHPKAVIGIIKALDSYPVEWQVPIESLRKWATYNRVKNNPRAYIWIGGVDEEPSFLDIGSTRTRVPTEAIDQESYRKGIVVLQVLIQTYPNPLLLAGAIDCIKHTNREQFSDVETALKGLARSSVFCKNTIKLLDVYSKMVASPSPFPATDNPIQSPPEPT